MHLPVSNARDQDSRTGGPFLAESLEMDPSVAASAGHSWSLDLRSISTEFVVDRGPCHRPTTRTIDCNKQRSCQIDAASGITQQQSFSKYFPDYWFVMFDSGQELRSLHRSDDRGEVAKMTCSASGDLAVTSRLPNWQEAKLPTENDGLPCGAEGTRAYHSTTRLRNWVARSGLGLKSQPLRRGLRARADRNRSAVDPERKLIAVPLESDLMPGFDVFGRVDGGM